MRQLILDTETTGLDPNLGHRIIEFAALEMVNRRLTGERLHLLINPERLIDIEASKIHGITDKDVKDKPNFKTVAPQIIEYMRGAELIIHNAKFDIGFIDYQLRALDLGKTRDYVAGVIDTLLLARSKFPGSRNSLDALCDRFAIDRSKRDYHGALIDCGLLAEVYLILTRQAKSLLEDEIVASSKEAFVFELIDDVLAHKIKKIAITENEQITHEEYLKKLDAKSKGGSNWYNSVLTPKSQLLD